MFYENQEQSAKENYIDLLKTFGSLSKLFSSSSTPFLVSRATENIFCKAFNTINHSRHDSSVDVSKNNLGLGIKTFLSGNGRTMQKVAEFNKDFSTLRSLNAEEKIRKIAELQNLRIRTTKARYGLETIIYHCIARRTKMFEIFETEFPIIDITRIENICESNNGKTITFNDNSAEYSFSVSKSTLKKRFVVENILVEIPVRILSDPYQELLRFILRQNMDFAPINAHPYIYLPLYSTRGGKIHVPQKSGLNQWNASGRRRNPDEIYIPIPSWIYKIFPTFFPKRYIDFRLILPDRTVLSASVCEDGGKALMSNPNRALGNWLLRTVLNLPELELVTYEKLQNIGLDSVIVHKINNHEYKIDFASVGAFETFKYENGQKAQIDENDLNDI